MHPRKSSRSPAKKGTEPTKAQQQSHGSKNYVQIAPANTPKISGCSAASRNAHDESLSQHCANASLAITTHWIGNTDHYFADCASKTGEQSLLDWTIPCRGLRLEDNASLACMILYEEFFQQLRKSLQNGYCGGASFRIPLGRATVTKIHNTVKGIVDVMRSQKNDFCHAGILSNACKIVRHLEVVHINHEILIEDVASYMVIYQGLCPGKIDLFMAVNSLSSFAKVMSVPKGEEYHDLIHSVVLRLAEQLKQNNNMVEYHKVDSADLDDFDWSSKEKKYHNKVHLYTHDLLALVVIAYSMMPLEDVTVVNEMAHGKNPGDYALDALMNANYPERKCRESERIFVPKILQMLYWCVWMKQNGTQTEDGLKKYVNILRNQFVSPQYLKRCNATESRVRDILKYGEVSNDDASTTKGYRLALEHEQLERDLLTEVDFVVDYKEGGEETRIFIEIDGPHHFVRNIPRSAHGVTGHTYLKTKYLMQHGKVLRVSTLCDSEERRKRLQSIPSEIRALALSHRSYMHLDPSQYPSDFVDTMNKVVAPNLKSLEEFPVLSRK
eukprot:TRINITY_DN1141_c0_g1_i4.p1 TRINITY_DN1141_c0_g1~~TRINITY_DN1141_c0_g1_i4.p1  ORF type:complete len:555 (-),score=107.07 TRINITY_DN1141_c0_g1_i4:228-1892(-)